MTAMTSRAVQLFAATSIVAALIVGAMLVGDWGGGLDNRIEWVFWAGAILGAIGIGMLGVAAIAEPEARVTRLTRIGVLLFLAAPVLCVIAVFTDYWI